MAEWNPLSEMEALRREIDRAFEGWGSGRSLPRGGVFLPATGPRQYPLINLLEDKDHLYVEALTPGVDPQSFNVTVVQNRVALSGEKSRVGENINPEAFHRNERASGKFMRSFDLPVEVDESKIEAEYRDGLLRLTLPKAEKAKPKQITVSVK